MFVINHKYSYLQLSIFQKQIPLLFPQPRSYICRRVSQRNNSHNNHSYFGDLPCNISLIKRGRIHILIPRAIDGQPVDVGATQKLKHEEQTVVCDEDMDLDVESPQGPSDIFTPKPIDEPMHDAHAEIGLGQGVDTQFVQKQVVDNVGEGGVECVGKVPIVEVCAAIRHDPDNIIF